jgi:hypothetical protein
MHNIHVLLMSSLVGAGSSTANNKPSGTQPGLRCACHGAARIWELELFRFGKREKAMAVVIALVKSRLDSEVVMAQA